MHLTSYSPRSLTAPRRAALLAQHFCLAVCLAIVMVLIGQFATSASYAQGHQHGAATQTAQTETPASPPTPTDSPAAPVAAAAAASNYHNPTTFTLRTGIAQGRMVYIGVGGDIDGQVNPTLTIYEGELIQINLINGEGAEHDIFVDHYNARSQRVVGRNASSTFSFTANDPGEFAYFCTIAGHRQAGMEGLIRVVAGPRAAPPTDGADVVRDPGDLPPVIGQRAPQVVKVDLETTELKGRLDDGTTYVYWTFNGKVPGPFLRVRVGDTVEVRLKNPADSVMVHSVDFHAATGPGGGAHATQTDPGNETMVTFKALKPGVFVYHCATPMVAHHITNGMYGLILVEPEGGLPQVDREFYVMQGELYTVESLRHPGRPGNGL